jgi:hypothetical protein
MINAEAAKKSAEITERTFSHSRQPDFAFKRKIPENVGVGETPQMRVTFLNMGRGDAFAIKIDHRFEVIPVDQLEVVPKMTFVAFGTTIVTAGTSTERIFTAKQSLTEEDVENIRNEKAALCLWGYVAYKNADDAKDFNGFSYTSMGPRFDKAAPVFGKRKVEIEWPEAKQNDDESKADH